MKTYANVLESIDSAPFTHANAVNFLSALSTEEIVSVLKDIVGCDTLLSQVATSSYVHQLEFEKYVIAKGEKNGAWLRLHHWPAAVAGDKQDIHNHCAPFASRILAGSLAHKHYVKCEGDEYAEYRYFFDEQTGVGASVLSDSTSLIACGDDHYVAGDVYTVDENLLHQVVETEEGTITMSFWGPRTKEAIVLQSSLAEKTKKAVRAGIHSDELAEKLKAIIKKLENDNGFI